MWIRSKHSSIVAFSWHEDKDTTNNQCDKQIKLDNSSQFWSRWWHIRIASFSSNQVIYLQCRVKPTARAWAQWAWTDAFETSRLTRIVCRFAKSAWIFGARIKVAWACCKTKVECWCKTYFNFFFNFRNKSVSVCSFSDEIQYLFEDQKSWQRTIPETI